MLAYGIQISLWHSHHILSQYATTGLTTPVKPVSAGISANNYYMLNIHPSIMIQLKVQHLKKHIPSKNGNCKLWLLRVASSQVIF